MHLVLRLRGFANFVCLLFCLILVSGESFASTPSRSIQNIFPFNYGVTTIAGADECAFINEMIEALPEAGGVVEVPQGDYVCLSPIILDRSNVTLTGVGDVYLKLGDHINAPIIVMGDVNTPPVQLSKIKVQNLKLDGNRFNQTFECWGGPCDLGGTTFIRNNGITVRGLTDGAIENVFITSTRSGGVVTEKGVYYLTIDGLTAVDNQFDGFAGYETSRSVLRNMNLSYNLAAGISIDIRFHGNELINTRIENNKDVGIFMRDANANYFENISIINSGNHGVFLSQVTHVESCSNGNEFNNLKIINSRGFGFRLNDRCGGNRLTGFSEFRLNRDGCISLGSIMPLEIHGEFICENLE